MSNKALVNPQLDKLEKYHQAERDKDITSQIVEFHEGWLDAIVQFRLMLEGVDVTVKMGIGQLPS